FGLCHAVSLPPRFRLGLDRLDEASDRSVYAPLQLDRVAIGRQKPEAFAVHGACAHGGGCSRTCPGGRYPDRRGILLGHGRCAAGLVAHHVATFPPIRRARWYPSITWPSASRRGPTRVAPNA